MTRKKRKSIALAATYEIENRGLQIEKTKLNK